MSFLWNVLWMKCPVNEMSCLWNVFLWIDPTPLSIRNSAKKFNLRRSFDSQASAKIENLIFGKHFLEYLVNTPLNIWHLVNNPLNIWYLVNTPLNIWYLVNTPLNFWYLVNTPLNIWYLVKTPFNIWFLVNNPLNIL